MRKIGAHVSASGGFDQAILRADAIGANCLQLFSGSPRIWQKKPLKNLELNNMFELRQKLAIEPVFTHALYLVNLASEKAELVEKSINSLQYELEFDALIKGAGVVVHVGSHQGRGWDEVKEGVAQRIEQILESTADDSTFLVENAAGQQGKLFGDLNEIRWLFDKLDHFVQQGRLGWCFDTCHGWAAGYGLISAQQSAQDALFAESKIAIKEIERLGLWSSLKCIHLNDSRDPFASGRDRHENITDGSIPETELAAFLNHKEVQLIPLITEVPGLEKNGPDAENIQRIKKIVGQS